MRRPRHQVFIDDENDDDPSDQSAVASDEDTGSNAVALRSRQRSRSRQGGSESTDTSEPGRPRRRLRPSTSSVESGSRRNVVTRTRSAASLRASTDLPKAPSDADTFLNTVAILIQQLRQHDRYGFFSAPVDREEAPDYDEIIRQPMDLGTMQQKLESGAYRRLNQVEQDLELIWRNCFTYNPSNSIYYREAARLQKWAHKQVQWARQRLSGIAAMPSSTEGQTASASTHTRDETTRTGRAATKRPMARTSSGSSALPPRLSLRVHLEPREDASSLPGTRATATATRLPGAETKSKTDGIQRALIDEASDPEASYAVAAQDPAAFIERVWRAYLARKKHLRIEKEHYQLYHHQEQAPERTRAIGDDARAMLSQWLGTVVKREANASEQLFGEVLEAAEIPENMLRGPWRSRMSSASSSERMRSSSETPQNVMEGRTGHPFEQDARDASVLNVGTSGSIPTPRPAPKVLWNAFRQAVATLRIAQINNRSREEQTRRYDTALALAVRIVESQPPGTYLKERDLQCLRACAENLVQRCNPKTYS
ncbi:hypothetical protein CCYA_CCYA19G4730 [Cyanidiococcus yangmingshanensis]|nr:hypothetical protein CCYA_CCYA19G4730 [Cyanidiococcus yangmingshanensis]